MIATAAPDTGADHARCAAGDPSLELAEATIQVAQRARDLAGKNVKAEQQKYQLGSITAFELLDSQSRQASAESALVTAYIGYQQASLISSTRLRACWTDSGSSWSSRGSTKAPRESLKKGAKNPPFC